MIQDLDFGYLDNHYVNHEPCDEDIVVCISGRDVLVRRDENKYLELPTWGEVKAWCTDWTKWFDEPLQYVFTLQEKKYFLWRKWSVGSI